MPLTLEVAVSEALARAPHLQSARAQARQAAWEVNGAASPFLPRLRIDVGHVFGHRFGDEATGATPTDAVVELKSPLTEVGMSLSLNLFDGMQSLRRLDARNLHKDAAEDEAQWEAFVLERHVRYQLSRVVAANRIAAAARQDVEALSSHREQVHSMRQQGAATDFDVLRIDVQMQNAKTAVVKAEDDIALARRKLAEVMGYVDDPRPVAGELTVPDAQVRERVEKLDTTALPTRPDLMAISRRAKAHDKLRAAAANFWLPKLDAAATGSVYNNWDHSFDANLFKKTYSLGLRMRWDIFDGTEAWAEAGAQKQAQLAGQHRLNEALLAQAYALEEAKRDFVYAICLYDTRVLNRQRAEMNVELAMAGLKNGTRDSTDVLDAEQDLFAARAGAIDALLHIEKSAIALELALGGPL